MSIAPAPLRIDELILPEAQAGIRAEIAGINGGEVFFVGRLDRELAVEEAESFAFGNRRAVPALLQHARPGDVIIHNHPSGNLEPSAADIEISSLAGERGIGSYIINNECTEVRIVVKAMRPRERQPLDADGLARMLAPGGKIAERLEGYEFRPPQLEMLRAVGRALNEEGILAVEAATGTGKSMAYLIPAIYWSLQIQEKVVISTNTINLQEQLVEKDLPLLRQCLDVEFDAVILKGRNNYLCKRKADFVAKNPDFLLGDEKKDQLDAIQAWVKTTRDGSLADLGFEPDSDVWERVMSESDNCLRTKCPFYQTCFFYNARRRAARAQLLIVNHHLLMADLALRAEMENYTQAAVLPPFHRIILDEAHHAEDVATDYFGARVSRIGFFFTLRRLASPKTGEGLLRFLSTKIHEKLYPMAEADATEWMIKLQSEYMQAHQELLDAVEQACERTGMALDENAGMPLDRPADLKQRVTEDFAAGPYWNGEIHPHLLAVITSGRKYVGWLHGLHKALYATIEEETPANMSPLLELRSAAGKIETHLASLMRFLQGAGSDCRWIEYRRKSRDRKPHVAFCSAPLDVARDLRERVLRRFRTVVMTSATLTVDRSFDYFLGRVGASAPEELTLLGSAGMQHGTGAKPGEPRLLETHVLETPFDFNRQVYVGVPADLPSPKTPEFNGALAEFLKQSLAITRGRALVLFTSYATLNRIHEAIAPELEGEGYPCLKQGAAGRTLLAETFRRDIGSILFATSSFWEGVDIPGEALSCLVLTRLPFTVPSEPIIEARVEAMKSQGIDPFRKLIIPQAVIRFRQGFGRLIRRREDRGAVLICDRRVASETYGQMFLRSLPTRRIEVAPAAQVQASLKGFFAEELG